MSQWFFSMRQRLDRELESALMEPDERKALSDALNPFARKNVQAILGHPTIKERFEAEMYSVPLPDEREVERQWASTEVKSTQYFSVIDAGYADSTVTVTFKDGIITAEENK